MELPEGHETQFQPVLLSANRDGREFWLVDGNVFPRSNVNKAIPIASREMLDVKERLRHLDELELDVQVLYPTIFLRQLTRKPEVEIALCKSYNRWLAELCQRGEGRVKWVATLPLMSMDAAVKEATFAKQHGACGLFTRGLVNNRLFNDPYFYPFFEEASRLDLPICILRLQVVSNGCSFSTERVALLNSRFRCYRAFIRSFTTAFRRNSQTTDRFYRSQGGMDPLFARGSGETSREEAWETNGR